VNELVWYSAYLEIVVCDRLLVKIQSELSTVVDSSVPCCICVRISTGWSGLASTSDMDENNPRSSKTYIFKFYVRPDTK